MRNWIQNHVLDAELVLIIIGALGLAWVVEGTVALSTMIVFLLFFLFLQTGLKTSFKDIQRTKHKSKATIAGIISIFILSPIAGLMTFHLIGGSVGKALMITSLAPASLTIPNLASERFNSDKYLADSLGAITLIASMIVVPAAIYILPIESITEELASNLWLVVLPVLIGLGMKNYDNGLAKELEEHSRHIITLLGLGFLFASLIYSKPDEVLTFTEFSWAIAGSTLLMIISGLAAFSTCMLMKITPKQVPSIVYSTSFKSVPVALYIGIFLGSKAIQVIIVYFAVSWLVFFGAERLNATFNRSLDERLIEKFRSLEKA